MSTEDLLKNNTQEKYFETNEVGVENFVENPGIVAEKLTSKIIEKNTNSMNKADARMGTAVNLGVSEDVINEGKKSLTDIRGKMKELENEYVSKLAGVVNQ